jgi:hypothetical protein
MVEPTAPAPENPLTAVKAQIASFLQKIIQPHTLSFNLTVAAAVGIITVIFATIILFVVMVAANFNLLGWIE